MYMCIGFRILNLQEKNNGFIKNSGACSSNNWGQNSGLRFEKSKLLYMYVFIQKSRLLFSEPK